MKKSILFVLFLVLFAAAYAYEDADSPSGNFPDDAAAESDTTTAETNDGRLAAPEMVGGRSRSSVQDVVTRNTIDLRNTYNARLREKRGFGGKVTVSFYINEFGKVIYARVVQSNTRDPAFDNIIMTLVKSWDFGPHNRPGDVTKVTYPFVFTP
jgi:TonB family protein